MLKLWILRPQEGLSKKDNLWEPWYDRVFGFIVAAETEEQARQLAGKNAGDEHRGCYKNPPEPNPWHEPRYTTCLELVSPKEVGIIMIDFYSA